MNTSRNITRTRSAFALKPALAAAAMVLLVTASPAQAQTGNKNPRVIPPDQTFRDLSYGQWGARWWSTVFSIPVVDGSHPLLSGGAFGGDDGAVFLAVI